MTYEVYAIKYAEQTARVRGNNYMFDDNHDAPDPIDFYMWLIRGEGRVILVDTGFDAAEGDVGGCHVTPECFGNLTRLLLQQQTTDVDSGCNVVAALEGGYVPTTLGKCVVQVVQAMLSHATIHANNKDGKMLNSSGVAT